MKKIEKTPKDDKIVKKVESDEIIEEENLSEVSSIVEVKGNRLKSIAWWVATITFSFAAGLSLLVLLDQGKA